MGNITVHAECTSGWDRIKPFLAQKGVETAMLLNANPDQIQYALDNCAGIVVVRVFDPFNEYASMGSNFERDIILRHLPSEFVNWLNSKDLSRFKGNPRVRFILGWNEMSYAGAEYQRRQNKAMIAVTDALIKAGYGVAMFGLASDKTIQMEDAIAGVWDETIEFLQEHSEWAHLDCHEYEVGKLASAHLKSYPKPYPSSIEDVHSMRYANWGEIAYEGSGIATNYHIGRIAWLLQRGKFPYARGEMGWDFKDDGALGRYIPDYSSRFGRPSGLNSLRRLFSHLAGKEQLSDREFCQEAWNDLEWFTSFDPDCLSNAIFADNNGRDHAAFNLGLPQYEHLYTLLGQQSTKETPMPIPMPTAPTYKARLSSKEASNVRREADTSAPIVLILTNAWLEAYVSEVVISNDGYEWYEVTTDTVHGYVAKAGNLVIERLGEPEPMYFLDLGKSTWQVNAETRDILAEIFDRLGIDTRNAPKV